MHITSDKTRSLRIHGELLKLGIDVGECTASRLLAKRCSPPQTWHAFLATRVRNLVSIDFFAVLGALFGFGEAGG